jgi:Holliday junction DNA helicase RuvA
MIGSIRGKVLRIDGMTALIEAHGVGYEVELPGRLLSSLKCDEECFVYTQHVVREDAELLYGFMRLEERSLFRTLIKVNGVGPKMALAVLSTFSVEDFTKKILDGEAKSLEQIPGVGRRTAERMLVELKDRLNAFKDLDIAGSSVETQDSSHENFTDAVLALTSLGYKENEAVKYVKTVIKEQGSSEPLSTQDLIVKSLALISKGGKH